MKQGPTIPSALDPFDAQGLRRWATIWILVAVTTAFGMYLPIYSFDDNPAFRSWEAHIAKEKEQAPSPSWPAVDQKGISFDAQMILEVRRCWDQPDQPDSAGPAIQMARKVAGYSTHIAKGEVVLATLLLIWIFAWRRKWHENLQRQLLAGFCGLFTASLIALAIKVIFGRGRPNELLWRGRLHWDSFAFDHNHHSFPSGHATASGALIMILILLYPRAWPIWLTMGAWLCATRVLMTEHWPTDTVTGFVLGAFCVALLTSLLERRRPDQVPGNNQSSRETVSPLE